MQGNNIGVVVGSVEHEEWIQKTKSWRVLYPYYFDKSVSRADGRKVPKSLAVDTPDVEDLKQILIFLKIPMMIELNKRHPSDHFCVGRIRYQLKNDDGSWANTEIQNSKCCFADIYREEFALYKKCGELIPKLKDRKSATRLDIVNYKPAPQQVPGKPKVMKIKGKRR